MKETKAYIEETKAKLGIESDYAFAKWLGITKQAASNYKRGISIIDDYTAARIAEALELNPLEVIAAANMEREKISERKEFWRKIASGGVAAAIFLAVFSVTYSPDINAAMIGSIHYAQCSTVTAPAQVPKPVLFPALPGNTVITVRLSFNLENEPWPKIGNSMNCGTAPATSTRRSWRRYAA